ncbi:MAG: phosphatase PAP2 family protein [Phenylobacterium sp.]
MRFGRRSGLRRRWGSAASLTAIIALAGCGTGAGPAPDAGFWTGFQDHPGGYSAKEAADVLNAARFISSPPEPSSAQAQADIAAYRSSRALAGSERWLQAAADNRIETPAAPYEAFACALGFEITPAAAPTLTHLLGKVLGEVQLVQRELKTDTFRARPFVAEPAPICITPEPWLAKSSSYPSGHAATGWAWALILAELTPNRREAVLARGLAYGESRMICGVHYASDVQAGQTLGAAVVASLRAKTQFQADIRRSRMELARTMSAARMPQGCGAQPR